MKIIRVPIDRVGAMIGKNGEVKRALEERAGVEIQIDSESGEVVLDSTKAKDPLAIMKVEEVIKAIGRGFSPEKAYRLMEDEMYLQILDIHDYVGKSTKHLRRIKARIIGKNGKTRRIIEGMTGAFLSIYGGTVSMIGDFNGVEVSKTAVDMILNGSEHATVYKYLERKRREAKLAKLDSIVAVDADEGDELGPFDEEPDGSEE
jgi:ribosomal RNA assembly protein